MQNASAVQHRRILEQPESHLFQQATINQAITSNTQSQVTLKNIGPGFLHFTQPSEPQPLTQFLDSQVVPVSFVPMLSVLDISMGKSTEPLKTRQYVTAETLTETLTLSARHPSPRQSKLHLPYPTDHRNHVRASYIHRIRLSQPRPYSSPAIFGINVMSAGSQATESSWSAESQRAASCSRRCGLPPAIVQA